MFIAEDILKTAQPGHCATPGRRMDLYTGMDALFPIVDMHCHVLPGVDDGPATMEDSIAILLEAPDRASTG